MFCPNCGSQLVDGSKFCPFCGGAIESRPAQNPAPVRSTPYESPDLSAVQSVNNSGYSSDPYLSDPKDDPRGMKWYKFVIYFQLFASMAVNLFGAVRLFTGAHYGDSSDLVYAFFPSLKTVDIIYGVFCIALVVFAFLARQALAKFRANGPTLYYALMIANVVGTLLYLISACSATGLSLGDMIDADVLSNVLVSVVMLVVNIIYFGKRRDLFVN